MSRLLILLVTFALTSACGDPTPPLGSQTLMLVVSGDAQQARVGTQLPDPVVARLVDENGNPRPGQTVTFVVTSGGGSVFAGAGTTNDQGMVQERWTVGLNTREEQRLEARMVDSTTGAPLVLGSFLASALADAPAWMEQSNGPSGQPTGVVGESVEVAVILYDTHGNPVPGQEVEWSAVEGGPVPLVERSVSGPDGIARSAWELPTVPASWAGEARFGELVLGVGFSSVPGSAVEIVEVAEVLGGVPGGRTAVPPNLMLKDGYGNLTSGTVRLRVVQGGGHLAVEGNPTEAWVPVSAVAGLYGLVPGPRVPSHFGGQYWVLGPDVGTQVLEAALNDDEVVTFTAQARSPFIAWRNLQEGSSVTPYLGTYSSREHVQVTAFVCQSDETRAKSVSTGSTQAALEPYPEQVLGPTSLFFPCSVRAWLDIQDLPSPISLTLAADDADGASDSLSIQVVR